MPIDLTFYRGEKKQWWPSPEFRLMGGGVNLYGPWDDGFSNKFNVNQLWLTLQQKVNGLRKRTFGARGAV